MPSKEKKIQPLPGERGLLSSCSIRRRSSVQARSSFSSCTCQSLGAVTVEHCLVVLHCLYLDISVHQSECKNRMIIQKYIFTNSIWDQTKLK
jgi:hypothetical protein